MASKNKEKNQHIQVFVRVRPLNQREGYANVVELKGNKEIKVKQHSVVKTYTFDRVFGPDSKQIEVYKQVAEPAVAEVIAGYNCTILAYGQTGTGKTYTMAGGSATDLQTNTIKTPWFDDEHCGIIPRTLSHLFDELKLQQFEYTLRVSYLELYNEEIFDLLSPIEDNSKLKLYDDSMKKGSIIVQGLTETAVNAMSEVYRILDKGGEKRRFAATQMNAHSSRSHTVFCITVHIKENSIDGEDLLKTGKLYLVDLAGSENIKQSGATEMRAREACSINQSLLTLGRCIVKLLERSAHIPYRESKLTRLLQDSLGGRTKTTLIATVSPALCNVDETLNTLEYANRAKHITNKPEINQRLSKKSLLKEYTEEIDRLRRDLLATRTCKGVYLDEENYEALIRERELHRDEIADKIGQLRACKEEMERKVKTCTELKMSLVEHQEQLESKKVAINSLQNKLEDASKQILDMQEQIEIKQYIVEKHYETEQTLKTTAKKLLSVAETTTKETKKLHDKIDVLSDLSKQNRALCEQHVSMFDYKMEKMNSRLENFQDRQSAFQNDVLEFCTRIRENREYLNGTMQTICGNLNNFGSTAVDLRQNLERACVNLESLEKENAGNIANFLNARRTELQEKVTVIAPNFDKLCDSMKQYQGCTDFLVCYMEEMLKRNENQLKEFIELVKVMITQAKEQVLQKLDDEKTFCGQVIQKFVESLAKQKQQQSVVEEKFRNVMTNMNELQKISNEYFAQNSAQNNNILEGISSACEAFGNSQTFITEFTQVKSNELFDCSNRIEQFTCTEIQNMAPTKDQITNASTNSDLALTELNTALKDFSENAITVCDKTVQIVSENSQRHKKMLDSEREGISCQISKLESDGREISATLLKENEQCQMELDRTVCCMKRKVDEVTSYNNNAESEISSEINQTRESVKKLFQSSLKEYKQTGETPQRKTYKYPRVFIETKAHDKLIEEFHKARSSSADISDEENVLNVQPEVKPKLNGNADTNKPEPLTQNNKNEEHLSTVLKNEENSKQQQ